MTAQGVADLQEAVGRIVGSPPESEDPPELTALALQRIAERLEALEAVHQEGRSKQS
jgi:hypothetical protein